MLDHARADAPNECCGFLLSAADTILEATPATNLTPSPTRYRVDPRDHFAVIRRARTEGLTVVGTYHSHPATPAVPSASDLAEATYPEYLCVIVSLLEMTSIDQIGAFRLDRGQFQRVTLVFEECGTGKDSAEAVRTSDHDARPSR